MKAMDLLDSFGQVRDSYVVQAGQFREGKQAPQTKRLSLRRPLLVGCAVVYMLSLQDLKPGEEIREDSRTGTTEVRQVLSLQGVVGTPGYLTSKEWYEWEQAYDPDMEIYHSDEAFSEDFGEEYHVSMEPISMEEFNATLSGYVPLNIEMKPMDEFPLS